MQLFPYSSRGQKSKMGPPGYVPSGGSRGKFISLSFPASLAQGTLSPSSKPAMSGEVLMLPPLGSLLMPHPLPLERTIVIILDHLDNLR